jgi:hypothetical protein
MGPRTCLDDVEKGKITPLPGLELRLLGDPPRSQSLYRLRYSGSFNNQIMVNYIVLLENTQYDDFAINLVALHMSMSMSMSMRDEP